MENETIQTDVSAEQVAENVATDTPEATSPATDPVTAREDKMARLRESRKAEIAGERRNAWLRDNPEQSEADYDALAETKSQADEGAAAGVLPTPGAAKAEATTAQPPATQQADGSGWSVINGVRVKTLMVNGQPRQVTEEQYDRMIQKDLAGDDKLRRAAEIEASLNRRQQVLDERERHLKAIPQPSQADAGEALNAAIAKHTELLLEGDVDAANKQMVEIINLGRASSTPNIDADAITAQAATRAVNEVERKAAQAAHNQSINEGWETLKQDYRDVVADPDALAFADIQVKRLREENPDWKPAKVIIEAGKYTREKLKLSGAATPGAVTTATTGNITDERKARKSSIRPLPNVAGRGPQANKTAQVDMSPQAKIARMRQGRVL